MIGRVISSQFRKPDGILGRFAGNIMARGNQFEARWTVEVLDIQPGDHVLEIGFGPGVAVQYAAEKAVQGSVSGIDYSGTMVQAARKRNREAIKAGRVDLRQGLVSSLPFAEHTFEKALSIHSLYFWPQPSECLEEVRRVLKPGGLLAVTIKPRAKWLEGRTPPPDLFTLYEGDEAAALLVQAGFRNVQVKASPQPDQFPGLSVLGEK